MHHNLITPAMPLTNPYGAAPPPTSVRALICDEKRKTNSCVLFYCPDAIPVIPLTSSAVRSCHILRAAQPEGPTDRPPPNDSPTNDGRSMHQPSFGFRDLPMPGIAVDDGSTGSSSSSNWRRHCDGGRKRRLIAAGANRLSPDTAVIRSRSDCT